MAKPAGHSTARPGNFTEHEIVVRECLKCRRKFNARGRFNRLCCNCHVTNAGEHGLRVVPSTEQSAVHSCHIIRKAVGNV